MATSSTPTKTGIKRAWWKEASVYQIYPASFKDSNGDGLGDIPGIISELDYIKNLGVDIVWLSPCLASPQVDMGYDISDYRDIHRPYGTMADHDALITGLHDRGMKYLLDLVVNHTSSEHAWFKDSISSKQSAKRDWYIWRPAKTGEDGSRQPPNNWVSYFGGSAWQWDEASQEYHLHLFAVEQPDLNWENPEVVEAVHDIIRFWLDRGVDGFRMDVINFISKTYAEDGYTLPDAPVTRPGFLQDGSPHFACGPRVHEFFAGMGKIMREYDAFTVGEMPGCEDEGEILKAVRSDRGELQMAFHFEIVNLDGSNEDKFMPRKWTLPELKTVTNKWQTHMIDNDGWNAVYIENHDQGRSISRYASDKPEFRVASGKMLATHFALQSGTPFVYEGQELAMINISETWPMEKYRDLETLNHWNALLKRDPPPSEEEKAVVQKMYRLKGRDNARTPVQWDSSPNAGFTTGQPWIDVHDDYKEWNAANQTNASDSVYSYWGRVLQLRKSMKDVFVYGNFKLVDPDHEQVFAYARVFDDSNRALVVSNFSEKSSSWTIPSNKTSLGAPILLHSYIDAPKVDVEKGTVELRPFESVVFAKSRS